MRFILASLLVLAACGSGGGHDVASRAVPSHGCARTAPITVSAVNGWPGIDPERYAEDLAASCVTLVEIEGLPYFDPTLPCCAEPYRQQRRALLKSMSAHKVTTSIVTQNSNAPKAWELDEIWFRRHITEIREDALEVGIEHVWLGSPSEPDAFDQARGRARAQIARDEWPGVFVMPARTVPRIAPWFAGIRYDYLEVHPGSVARALYFLGRPEPLLVVTDNSTLLVPGDADLRALTSAALRLARPLVFYDFAATAPNLPALGSIADEIMG